MATAVPDLLLPEILLNHLYLIFLLPSVCQILHQNIYVVLKSKVKEISISLAFAQSPNTLLCV